MLGAIIAKALPYYNSIDAVVRLSFEQTLRNLGDTSVPVQITKNLPFVESPTAFVLFMAFYFGVLAIFYPLIAIKQRWQGGESKAPDGFLLRSFVLLHNLFLAFLSLWMGVQMVYYWFKLKYPLWGIAFDPVRDKDISFIMYVFYVSKYYEFMDTFIMLIKGNLKQISVLHVFHHASTCFIFWWVSCRAPGGDAYFCITLNCWVHVVMYFYYLATTIVKDPAKRKRYLWWGKYLTQLQMFQFFANFSHAIWCLFYSPYPMFGIRLQAVDMAILLTLFGQFYVQKYLGGNGKNTEPSSTSKDTAAGLPSKGDASFSKTDKTRTASKKMQ